MGLKLGILKKHCIFNPRFATENVLYQHGTQNQDLLIFIIIFKINK